LTGKERDVGVDLVKSLQNTKYSINEKLENSFINLFDQKGKVSSEALGDAQGTNEDVEQHGKVETSDNNEIDSDASESSDGDEADAITNDDGNHLKEQIEFHNGRQRRKAIFGNDIDHSDQMVSLKVVFPVWKLCHCLTCINETSFCYGNCLSIL
jgi:ribosome biogenesis protein BMS1